MCKIEHFSWLKTGYTEERNNANRRNYGFLLLQTKIFKIQTYKYYQNDRLDDASPLHLLSSLWAQNFRSYDRKTKIFKIAAILKNGCINGEDITFLAFLAFLWWFKWCKRRFIVKKKWKSWHFGPREGASPP